MGITPIEMYTMVPKSQEASVVKQNETTKMTSQQNNVINQINHNIQHDSMKTVRAMESDNPEYRYDAKEKGNGSYSSGNRQKKKNSDNEKEKPDEIKLSNFDIRI